MRQELDIKRTLVKRYHALAVAAGMTDEDRATFLWGHFRVTSSLEMDEEQLLQAVRTLEGMQSADAAERNKWRKRVMRAIGEYLKAMNRYCDSNVIKGVARRAAQAEDFNKIPLEKLRSLYNAFTMRRKDLDAARRVADEVSAEEDLLRSVSVN